FHALQFYVFLQALEFFLQLLDFLWRRILVAFEISTLGQIELRQQRGNLFFAYALVQLIEESEIFVQNGDELSQSGAFQFGGAFAVANDEAFRGALHHDLDEFMFVFYVLMRLAFLDAEERWLRNVNVAALDQFLHVAKEERKQQSADVRAVH